MFLSDIQQGGRSWLMVQGGCAGLLSGEVFRLS